MQLGQHQRILLQTSFCLQENFKICDVFHPHLDIQNIQILLQNWGEKKKINPLREHNNSKLFSIFQADQQIKGKKKTLWETKLGPSLRLSPICAEVKQVAQNQVLQDETLLFWLFLNICQYSSSKESALKTS